MMNDFDKLLTVVVPSYNMELFLRDCLDSLLVPKVLLYKLDVVVVNDGSHDATSTIAHEYSDRIPDVFRVIDKTNGNYGSCINAALPFAKGVFVKVLDADDTVDTDHFADFLRFMQSVLETEGRDGVDLFLSDFDFVDPNGVVTRKARFLAGKEDSRVQLNDLSDDDIADLWTHAVTYRTEILRSMNYHQTEGVSYSDNDWTFFPMSRVERVVHFSKPVNRYLVGRPGQTVEGDTYLNRFQTILSLTKAEIRFYGKNKSSLLSGGESFLRRLLLFRVRHSYLMILVMHPERFQDSDRRDFDEEVRANLPELEKALFSIRASRFSPVRPIAAWRRTGSVKSFPFRFHFFFKRVTAWVWRIFPRPWNGRAK